MARTMHCGDHFRIQIMIKTFLWLIHPRFESHTAHMYDVFMRTANNGLGKRKRQINAASLLFCIYFVFNAHTTIQFLDHCHLAFFFNLYRIDFGGISNVNHFWVTGDFIKASK